MNKNFDFDIKLTLRSNGKAFFGPGVAELLEDIDSCGNVKEAATKMCLSYSKAWTILKNAESGFGQDLVLREKGGTKGGGKACLTAEGKKLLSQYNKFNEMAFSLLEAEYQRIFNEDKE